MGLALVSARAPTVGGRRSSWRKALNMIATVVAVSTIRTTLRTFHSQARNVNRPGSVIPNSFVTTADDEELHNRGRRLGPHRHPSRCRRNARLGRRHASPAPHRALPTRPASTPHLVIKQDNIGDTFIVTDAGPDRIGPITCQALPPHRRLGTRARKPRPT